jgi:WD40 repeat protein
VTMTKAEHHLLGRRDVQRCNGDMERRWFPVAASVAGNGPIFALRFKPWDIPRDVLCERCLRNHRNESLVVHLHDAIVFRADLANAAGSPVSIDDVHLAILSDEFPGSCLNCWQFGEFPPKYPLLQLSGHEKLINDTQYDKLSGYIAIALDDHSVRLWKLDKASSYHEFKTHTGSMRAVCFQPTDSESSPGSSRGIFRRHYIPLRRLSPGTPTHH